ncbi:MAG: hypothetical protein K2H36_03710, partial [Clostridia bacterium]|nr:hypothetical protein [Clostridia bacterium]
MDIRKKKIKGYFALTVILITCLCIVSAMSFFMPYKRTEAISDLQQVKDLGNLLVDNYEGKEKIFDGNQLSKLYSALLSEDGATYADVKSATSGANGVKTSEDFRSEYNDGKDLVVTIGGIEWSAMYLSTNRSGDPILTLWQASSTQTAKWNYHSVNANANIPSNMYSTSMIRTITLNAGGTYYTSNAGTGATPVSQDASNTYAKFTMDSVTGSLTDFIDKPANVAWQEKQISHLVNGYAYDFNNDAYGNVGSGGGSNANWYSGMVNYYGKTDYGAWANDYIWLPSKTEAGWCETSYTARGLWKTHALERGNAGGVNSWLRSAHVDYYSIARTLLADGSDYNSPSTTDSFAVRPAFHLNLAKVEEASTAPIPQTKGDTKKYYDNGNDVVFELDKIGSDYVDINVAATDMEGNSLSSPSYTVNNSVLSFNANQVGKYVVTVKPKDGECWADGTNSEKSYTYYLKYHVTPLLFASDPSNLGYKGTTQYIEVENYSEDFMTVTPSTGAAFEKIPSGDNAGNWAISATNAGDNYKVTVSLKNTEFMEWTDNDQSSPKTLTFNISKKALNPRASSLWSTEVYTGKEYELTLDCADEDIGKLRFEGYYTGGGITEETKVAVQPVMSATEKKVTIKLPRLSDKGTYSYILRLAEGIAANSNYTLSFNYSFEVGNKKIDLSSSDIVWRYANSNIDGGTFKSVSESDLDVDGVFNVDYNGYGYSFEVNILELSEDIRDSIDYEYTGIQSATDVKIGSGNVVEYYT